MEKTIIVCDRCGKQIDKGNKQHITSLSCHYCFEVCNECYKILYSIKTTKEKEHYRYDAIYQEQRANKWQEAYEKLKRKYDDLLEKTKCNMK